MKKVDLYIYNARTGKVTTDYSTPLHYVTPESDGQIRNIQAFARASSSNGLHRNVGVHAYADKIFNEGDEFRIWSETNSNRSKEAIYSDICKFIIDQKTSENELLRDTMTINNAIMGLAKEKLIQVEDI